MQTQSNNGELIIKNSICCFFVESTDCELLIKRDGGNVVYYLRDLAMFPTMSLGRFFYFCRKKRLVVYYVYFSHIFAEFALSRVFS